MNRPWYRGGSENRWYATIDGKQVPLGKDPRFERSPKKKPKEPPAEILRKYHALVGQSVEGKKKDQLFSFCVDKYLASLSDCTECTRRQAKLFLERFLKESGDRLVSELRTHHVTEFLKGKAWKPNTLHNVVARIHSCLNHCVREDYLDYNPLKGKLQIPPVERRELNLATNEQTKLEDVAKGPFRVFLVALRELGCRPGELGKARVENCDLEKGVLKVENKTRKKTGVKMRPVVLTTKMMDICRELIGDRKEGYLFLNARGTPWQKSAIRNRMVKMCAKLGFDRVPYEFRHRWASDAINQRGINPAIVALQMGHSDLKQLMKTYLHADTDAIRKALEGS